LGTFGTFNHSLSEKGCQYRHKRQREQKHEPLEILPIVCGCERGTPLGASHYSEDVKNRSSVCACGMKERVRTYAAVTITRVRWRRIEAKVSSTRIPHLSGRVTTALFKARLPRGSGCPRRPQARGRASTRITSKPEETEKQRKRNILYHYTTTYEKGKRVSNPSRRGLRQRSLEGQGRPMLARRGRLYCRRVDERMEERI
jgi:hypothetical protein